MSTVDRCILSWLMGALMASGLIEYTETGRGPKEFVGPPVLLSPATPPTPTRIVVTRTVKGECEADVVEPETPPTVVAVSEWTPPPTAAARPEWGLGLTYPVIRGRGSPAVEGSARVGDSPLSLLLSGGLDGSVAVGGRWDFN